MFCFYPNRTPKQIINIIIKTFLKDIKYQ